MRTNVPQFFAVQLLLVCSMFCVSAYAAAADVREFSLYVHENRAQPDPSLIVVATATGNLTEIGFGTIQVFSNVLTSGPSINSTAIGVEPGFGSIGIENIFISYTFTLNLPEGNGTLAVQGQFALNVWPRELAVVGGTGIFRFASGYDISEIIDDSNPADYVYRGISEHLVSLSLQRFIMGKSHRQILSSLVVFWFLMLVGVTSAIPVQGGSHIHLKPARLMLQSVPVAAEVDANTEDSRKPLFFKPMTSRSPCTDDFILTFFGPCSTSSMYPSVAPSELCCNGAFTVSDDCLCYMQGRLHLGDTLGMSLNGLLRILAVFGRTSTICGPHLPRESTARGTGGANMRSP
ncbi:hypothetical protein R1sor_020566 [Riccia sorocarpa]|uniref:Dirigent protein n=1 Tax=Riccia sorocarpa TaxID=122646 RepID=A0ABD3IM00_9MARC